MASAYLRNGRVYVAYRDQSGRRRFHRAPKTIETRREAKAWAQRVEDDGRAYRDRQDAPLQELFEKYVLHKRRTLKASSADRLERDLQRFLDTGGLMGSPVARLREVRPELFDGWLDRGQAGLLAGQRGAWSASTANQAGQAVLGWLRWCRTVGLIDYLPVEAFRVRKGSARKVRRSLSPEELERLLACVPDRDQRDLLRFLSLTGLRVVEAASLRWRDVVRDAGYGWAAWVRPSFEKAGRGRAVPLCAAARAVLEARRGRATWDSALKIFGQGGSAKAVALRVWKALRLAVGAAGLERPEAVDVHALRVSFATNASQAGLSPWHIQRYLGHASPKMTERYVRLDQASMNRSAEALKSGWFDLAKMHPRGQVGEKTDGGEAEGLANE